MRLRTSAEATDRRADDSPIANEHVLLAKQFGLEVGVARDDAGRRVHDAPPGHLDLGRRENPTHESSLLRVARHLGDVAVRRDLADAQGDENGDDSLDAFVAVVAHLVTVTT